MLLTPLILAFAPASDWFVDVNATAPGAGTAALPYASIEYAIAQPGTLAGDRILVAPGIYTNETIDFLGKALTLEASGGAGSVLVQGPQAHPTDIPHLPGSGGTALVRLVNGEGTGTRIVGFDFEGGSGEDLGTRAVGGVVYMQGAHLELIDCNLSGSANDVGGALFCIDSTLLCVNTFLEGFTHEPQVDASNFNFPVGGSIGAESSVIELNNCFLKGRTNQSAGSQSGPSRRHTGMQLHLVDCQSTLTGTNVELYGTCQTHCDAGSQIRVEGGSLTMTACTHLGSGPVGASRYIETSSANLILENMDFVQFGGIWSGRVLRGGGNALIRNCTFSNAWFGYSDMAPQESGPGGLIAFGGQLVIDNCQFSNNWHNIGIIAANSIHVRNSTFTNNWAQGGYFWPASLGGTIHAENALIEDSHFQGNRAWTQSIPFNLPVDPRARGGALYLTGPSLIRNCTFIDNSATTELGSLWGKMKGGAIYALEPIRVEDCIFQGNRTRFDYHTNITHGVNSLIGSGGALYLEQGGEIERCLFEGNRGTTDNFDSPTLITRGGAIYSGAGNLHISDSVFRENGSERGAAIFVDTPSTASITRSLFQGNYLIDRPMSPDIAGGVAWSGNVIATQCTIVQHGTQGGPGTLVEGGELDSCIVWDTAVTPIPSGLNVAFSAVEGGYPGIDNMAQNPLFWGIDDFQLQPASPAINGGNPTLLDPDGTRADMGAFPFEAGHCGGPGGVQCAATLGSSPCASTVNSTGSRATTHAFGNDQVSANFFTLSSLSVPENSFGYYLISTTQGFSPLFGGSDGHLCLGGLVHRLKDQVLFSSPTGRVGRAVDLESMVLNQTVLPGSSWHFQLWFRDSGSPNSTNTSDSLRVQFQ